MGMVLWPQPSCNIVDELLQTPIFLPRDSEPVRADFGHILLGVGHAMLAGALEALAVGLCRA